MRGAVFDGGLSALFAQPLTVARAAKVDRYGIRAAVEVDGVPIKMEIVREGTLELTADTREPPYFAVPSLSTDAMFATKLLANADRGDIANQYRDMFDLAMLSAHAGVSESALEAATRAYGPAVMAGLRRSGSALLDQGVLDECCARLSVASTAMPALHRGLAVLRLLTCSPPKSRPRPT